MLDRMEPYQGAMTIPLRTPRRFMSFFDHLHEVMRGPGELPIAEREFVAAVTSCANGSDTCFAEHAALALALGIPEASLKRLTNPMEDDFEPSGRLQALRRFAQCLSKGEGPCGADWLRCAEAGLDELAMELVITIIAVFCAVNRLAVGARGAAAVEGGYYSFTADEARDFYRDALAAD